MSDLTDLQAAVARLGTNSEKLAEFVNGGPTETVETDGGPIKTLAKAVADAEAAIVSIGSDAAAARDEAEGFASEAAASALAANVPAHTNPRQLAPMLHFDGATTGAKAVTLLGETGNIGISDFTLSFFYRVPMTISTTGENLAFLINNSTGSNAASRAVRVLLGSGLDQLLVRFYGETSLDFYDVRFDGIIEAYGGKTVLVSILRRSGVWEVWMDQTKVSISTGSGGTNPTLPGDPIQSTYLRQGSHLAATRAVVSPAQLYNYAKTDAEIADIVRQGPAAADFAGGSMVEQASGLLTIGRRYRITAQSTSDFTTAGAANNDVGTEFVAITTGSGLLDADNKVIPLGLIANPQITRTAQLRDAGPNKLHGVLTSGVTPLGGQFLPITWTQSATGYVLGDNPLIFDPHFICELWVKPTTSTIPNVTFKRGGASGTEVVAAESAGTQNVWKKLTVIASAAEGAALDKYHVTFSTSADCEFRLVAQPL